MNPLARTSSEIARYYNDVERERDRIAVEYRPPISSALISQFTAAENQYFRNQNIGRTVESNSGLLASALDSMIRKTILAFARMTYEGIMSNKNGDDVEEMFNREASAYAAQRTTEAQSLINERTRSIINAAVSRGIRENLPNRDIASLIASAGDVSSTRALMIARTETTMASNFANEVGANATGLPLQKSWIATLDDRTRDSHLEMHRRPADATGTFTLPNGVSMRRPGDPEAPAKEIVNCRCTMVWEVLS